MIRRAGFLYCRVAQMVRAIGYAYRSAVRARPRQRFSFSLEVTILFCICNKMCLITF